MAHTPAGGADDDGPADSAGPDPGRDGTPDRNHPPTSRTEPAPNHTEPARSTERNSAAHRDGAPDARAVHDPARMPPWLPRAFVLAAATVLAFGAGLWLLDRLRGLLLLLVMSLFLAFAIEPGVNWLAARGWRRGLATGLMFLLIAVLAVGFSVALGSVLIKQTTTLVDNAPRYADQIIDWTNRSFGARISKHTLVSKIPAVGGELSKHLSDLAGNVWGIGMTAVGVLFRGLGVLLFTFYLSAQGPQFRRTVCSLLPPKSQRQVLRAWTIAVDKTGGYIYSRALLAAVSAVFHYAALTLLDVPYALTLALWVGVVSQFIPTVGTYLAGAAPVLIALTKAPSTALWTLLFVIAYQQFENYVLQPRITARTLDMHPAVAFGVVIGGAAVIGPVGAVLSLPLVASVQAFLDAYVRRYHVEEHPLTARPPRGHDDPTHREPGRRTCRPDAPQGDPQDDQ
ncbi:AI-2E family transporter [Actinomadura logoneensis]|uniref:AI-2E family transporter n=1 Tax=Actinomadura logoneensis TaxID=2293572 RepID=A0A372JMC0_9ACTN|nr:AI-2E family transporter [Actinomadura logoneensis]RFU40934.1 AI-2E family transporter [Actinomadura logoneensis]